MKFLLAFLFVTAATLSNASEINLSSENMTRVETFDGGKKRQKRMNKKRKRKCKQWGRRVYAG